VELDTASSHEWNSICCALAALGWAQARQAGSFKLFFRSGVASAFISSHREDLQKDRSVFPLDRRMRGIKLPEECKLDQGSMASRIPTIDPIERNPVFRSRAGNLANSRLLLVISVGLRMVQAWAAIIVSQEGGRIARCPGVPRPQVAIGPRRRAIQRAEVLRGAKTSPGLTYAR